MERPTRIGLVASLAVPLAFFAACGKEESKPAPAATTSAADDHGHHHDHDHDHDHGPNGEHAESEAGHGGPVIQLGSASIGAFNVLATRDEGAIIAGKEAPIDVTVTPTPDATAKVVAVRFWIGTENAKGSVKAKADIENPAEPNRWHTHAEVPNPIPANARLWVEIEDSKGQTHLSGFDLKS